MAARAKSASRIQVGTRIPAASRRDLLRVGSLAVGVAGATWLARPARHAAAQDKATTFSYVGTYSAPDTLDPAENWSGSGGFDIIAHVYDALFRFEGAETATLVPLLAAEVPTLENGGISEDGLQYTIRMRSEARFANGSPLTAEAVKYSYDRVKALALGVDFLLDQIVETEVVDDHTVRFHIEQLFSPFLSSLGSVFANSVVNPAIVEANSTGDEDLGHEWLLTHGAGSGAYVLDSFDQDLGRATLVRNENWWQGWSDGPHLDRILVQWIPEAATARLMLEQGDADYVAGVESEALEALAESPGIVPIIADVSLGQSYIALNTQMAPWDNRALRQALGYALNYDVIINDIWGGGQQLDSVTPPMVGYAPAATQYTHDLERAQALIAEAGYPDGLDIEIYVAQGDADASLALQLLQADLASIGVNLTITPMESNAMFNQHLNGDPAAALPAMFSYMGSDYPDAYQLLALTYGSRSLPPAGCCNFGYYSNPEMDEIIARVETELVPELRQAALQEGFDLAFVDEPFVMIQSLPDFSAMRDRVQGWEYNYVNGSAYLPYSQMWLDE